MTPIESRNEEMSSRVRIFSADKLSAEAREEKWDRVKVVCTQPFNSRVKYGLSFLKLNEKDLEVCTVSGTVLLGLCDNTDKSLIGTSLAKIIDSEIKITR